MPSSSASERAVESSRDAAVLRQRHRRPDVVGHVEPAVEVAGGDERQQPVAGQLGALGGRGREPHPAVLLRGRARHAQADRLVLEVDDRVVAVAGLRQPLDRLGDQGLVGRRAVCGRSRLVHRASAGVRRTDLGLGGSAGAVGAGGLRATGGAGSAGPRSARASARRALGRLLLRRGFGFGLRTSAGSACASPSVDWPAMPDATSSGSAGEPGAPVPGLACPVLLSAYATASATKKAAAAANNGTTIEFGGHLRRRDQLRGGFGLACPR